MQFSLTITGPLSELGNIASLLSGTATTVVTSPLADPAQPPLPFPSPLEVNWQTSPVEIAAVDDDDAPNAAPPALDSTGLPWDARIHAASKGLTANGQWRKRRGIMDELVAAVESELRGTPPAPAAPVEVAAVEPFPVVSAPIPAPVEVAPVQQHVPFTPPSPVPVPIPVPVPTAPVIPDFGQFMQSLSGKMMQGIVTTDDTGKLVAELSTAFNVPLTNITEIADRPDMIEYAVHALARDGK